MGRNQGQRERLWGPRAEAPDGCHDPDPGVGAWGSARACVTLRAPYREREIRRQPPHTLVVSSPTRERTEGESFCEIANDLFALGYRTPYTRLYLRARLRTGSRLYGYMSHSINPHFGTLGISTSHHLRMIGGNLLQQLLHPRAFGGLECSLRRRR